MERVMGIEPTSSAWEAEVLPLNNTRLPVETADPDSHVSLPAVLDILTQCPEYFID